MSEAVIKLCVYAGTLERCRFVFLVFLVKQGEGCFFFFFAISLMGVLASRLAWLNCHRILAGAILLERGCVVLGVRFSSAMLVWVAFEVGWPWASFPKTVSALHCVERYSEPLL